MKKQQKKADKGAFKRVRTIKDILLGLQVIVILILVGLSMSRGYSVDPLYIPFEGALFVLLLGAVILSIELIVFRALEIKHAPTDGQRFIITTAGLRSAKRAAVAGVVLALFFAVPVTQALLTNVISPAETRNLEAGESYLLAFSSEDPMGLTKARSLRVTVMTGALRLNMSVENQPVGSGTDLSAGEQYFSAISSASFVAYVVSFENLVDARTRFSFRVDMALSPPLAFVITVSALVVAGTNVGWLIYLRRVREDLPEPPPKQRARVPPMPMTTTTRRPARPWYEMQQFWRPGPSHWGPPPPPGTPPGPGYRAPPPPPPPEERANAEPKSPVKEGANEESVESLLREASLDVPSTLEKAQEEVEAGEFLDALEDFETVLHFDGRNQEALLGKADVLRRLGRREESLQLVEEILHMDPWSEEALLAKGRLLEEQGRDEEALGCYEAVLHGGPRHLEALVRKGDMLTGKGEHELARETYEKALHLKPGDRELKEKIGSLEELKEDVLDIARREAKAGNVSRAEEFYKRALGGERAGEARRELIDLYFHAGREEDCLLLLDQALEEAPEDYRLMLKRAQALSKAGRLAEALEDCARACEKEPDLPSVWAIKGALEADMGLEGRAVESLERALSLNPEDDEAERRLKELKQREKKRTQLEEELRSMPEVPVEAVNSLLQAFSSIQELKKAKIKTLTSLDGVTDEVAKAILKHLRKGR